MKKELANIKIFYKTSIVESKNCIGTRTNSLIKSYGKSKNKPADVKSEDMTKTEFQINGQMLQNTSC